MAQTSHKNKRLVRRASLVLTACLALFSAVGCGSEFRVFLDDDRQLMLLFGLAQSRRPKVAITMPNGGKDFSTNLALQVISGTCSSGATLSMNTGSFDDADCSDGTWSLAAMTLASGPNTITVSATDADLRTASDTITITYTASAGTNTVFWSEITGGIKSISNDGTGETTILSASGTPLDIALYSANGQIYWTQDNATTFQIWYANVDGSGATAFLTENTLSGSFGPTDIDIDTVNDMIYWDRLSPSDINDIWRSSLSSLVKEKWANNLPYDHTFCIALDSQNSKIYFDANTFWDIDQNLGTGRTGAMYIADMNTANTYSYQFWGSGPSDPSVSLRGIAVDASGGHIFYVNSAWNALTIMRRDLSLQNATVWITANGFDIQKLGLDLVGRKIYWTSRNPNRIYRANIDQAESGIELFHELSAAPTGIAISQ